MKQFLHTILMISLCFLLLSSCTQTTEEPVTLSCRVIASVGDELVLASEGHEPIMVLTPAANPKLTILRDGAAAKEGDMPLPGDRILLTFTGRMLDTQPSVPQRVTQMDIISAEFDNLAPVYLAALSDLAKEEEAVITERSMLAVSLEDTALPAWEQRAVTYAVARLYPQLTVIEESRSDLMAKGFLTQHEDGVRWYWDGGSFLSVHENPIKRSDRQRYFNVNFNCGSSHAWTNCRTSRSADSGVWSPYDIGGIARAD